MRIVSLLILLLVSVFTSTQASQSGIEATASADLVLRNARVYTLDWDEPSLTGTPASNAPFRDGQWQPDASALAIKDGTIMWVGNDSDSGAWVGDATQVVDLNGATAIPGLIDSHVHIAELGEILERVNLSDVTTPAEAIKKVQRETSHIPDGEWVIGQGWDEGAWANNYPNRQMLDAAFPNHPVMLRSLHGFAVWANSKALTVAGIEKGTPEPVGGEILRDTQGLPTGILLNRATTLLSDAIPKPSVSEFAGYIRSGMQQMAKDGFVSVHEAGAETLHIAALEYLNSKQQLPIRMYAMLSARDEALAKQWQNKGPQTDPSGFLDIRSVKAYYDGALGSRGARLLEDYSDMPGHRGVSGDGYGFDAQIVEDLIVAGFQVGVHAIGDAGNREVLDFLKAVENKHSASAGLRHRVEHAQVIHPDDFARFKSLNLIASMEPPHAVEDKTWAEDRLGSERIKGAYAWRTLRLNDVALTFNSDLPGSDHSIFYALHAAVTRRDKQAEPEQGWYPEQNVSIEEAIRGYTNWAAYSAFQESVTGVLKPGHWGDVTVMNIDPFTLATANPKQILQGKILVTVVDGKIVYQAAQ